MDSIVATIQPADCEQCKLAHMQADSQTSTDSEDLLQVDGATSEDNDYVTDDHPVQPKQAFFTVESLMLKELIRSKFTVDRLKLK